MPVQTEIGFIEETLRAAAAALRGRDAAASTYTDVKGYLAEADLLAHAAIRDAVRRAFPRDAFLSEEGVPEGTGRRVWITDPICGTTNYVRGIPLYAHALSAVREGRVEAAGIYCPATDEMFLADPGSATRNGRPIRVSKTPRLSEALVAVNCNQSDTAAHPGRIGRIVERLQPPTTRRIRIHESANLELAYVACGRLDGYANPDDKPWDIAAGSLLIEAAGGRTATFAGSLADPAGCRGVVAANGLIFDELDRLSRREAR